MKKMLYNILIVSLSVFLINLESFASDKSVQLLSFSDRGVQFSVNVSPEKLIPRTVDKSVTLYSHTVTVAIPVGAKVELVSVQGYDRQLLKNKSLAQSSVLSSFGLAALGQPFIVRGRQLVNVELFPITSSGYYATIEIALRFTGGSSVSTSTAVPDPHFDKLLSKVVMNFEQARDWAAPRPIAAKSAIAVNPFGESSDWFKISVPKTAIYKVTGSALSAAGLNLSGLTSSSIRVFNGGGLPLPIDNNLVRPEFEEIAISVVDGGDGRFDASDYFILFGEGVDRWIHAPSDSFINNPYTTDNCYWLSTSPSISGVPRRMANVNYTGPTPTTVTSFRRFVHTERDEMLQRYYKGEIYDYYNWFWTDQSSLTIHASTPGAISGTVSNLFLAGKTFGTHMSLFVGGIPAINKNCDNNRCTFSSLSVRDGLTQLVINQSGNSNIPPYFDFADIAYTSTLLPQGERIDLTLGTLDGGARLNIIDNFSGSPTVLDVTDGAAPRVIASVIRSGGLLAASADFAASNYSRLFVDTLATDMEIAMVTTTDLRSNLSQVDYLIIAPDQFRSALQEYVDYRSGSYRSCFVSVEDILDNFSFGLYDPAAIRDFLHFAYDNFAAPAPTYVLFVGDGSYDFMDIHQTGQENFVPPFVHPADTQRFYSDDNFVYFGAYGLLDGDTSYVPANPSADRGYDMISARWPVSSEEEIAIIIGKIKSYESKENRGAWRSKVTVVADDEFAAGAYNEAIHTEQAEILQKDHLPGQFENDKIYLWDYPRVGSKRPGVNDAIVDAFNDGTLLINYVGHGNPDLWAHEHVFTRNEDLPRLDNENNLPLVFTASCEIAFFDDPEREGMAEDLLTLPNGAVGVISATRRVYSGPNADLNRKVFDVLFGERKISICEALYMAKLQRQYLGSTVPHRVGNDQAYLYFGDPLMRLGIPEFDLMFDSLPDSIMALSPYTVFGRVVDSNGTTVVGDGELFVRAFDTDRRRKHYVIDTPNPSNPPLDSVEYFVNGPSIFRGSASVISGEFQFTFIPPLDIAYGGTGAKISGYTSVGTSDGFGVADSLVVSRVILPVTDSAGPEITFSVVNRKDFISGDFIAPGDELQIDLTDPIGINLTGGIGHGISLEIDSKSDNLEDLTELFQYDLNSYNSGSLIYSITDMEPGLHQFKVKAWDNANNFSTAQFSAEVVISSVMAIRELLNYPNPMADSTRFSYYLTQPVRSFSLEIFTLSGRKIRSFKQIGRRTAGYYDDIVWYGDDFAADRVATGVYIFKAEAIGESGDLATESFGKLVLIN